MESSQSTHSDLVTMTDLEEVLEEKGFNAGYQCENPGLFKTAIIEIIKGNENAFQNYMSNGGEPGDVCVGRHKGSGEYTIVHLIKAIVLSGNVNMMKKFLDEYPDYIDYFDNEYTLLSYSIVNKKFDISNYLLDNKINPNMREKRNRTSLYYVIFSGNYELFEKMIKCGADPNLEYAMPRLNMLYHCVANCYSHNKTNENYKKMCLLMLKNGTTIQHEKYNKEDLDILEELQAELKESA